MRHEPGLLLALAVAAGAVDAISYLGLGQVFTANMTGNTVLLGVAIARHSGSDAVRAIVALTGFCLGGGIGILIVGTRRPAWPRPAAWVFTLETLALAIIVAIWAAAGVGSMRYLLVVLAGVAMGAQSAAVRGSGVPGVNTTFMTSTMLNAIARLIVRSDHGDGPAVSARLPGAAWAIYALGALIGALVDRASQPGAAAIPLAVVSAVTAICLLGWPRRATPERVGTGHHDRG